MTNLDAATVPAIDGHGVFGSRDWLQHYMRHAPGISAANLVTLSSSDAFVPLWRTAAGHLHSAYWALSDSCPVVWGDPKSGWELIWEYLAAQGARSMTVRALPCLDLPAGCNFGQGVIDRWWGLVCDRDTLPTKIRERMAYSKRRLRRSCGDLECVVVPGTSLEIAEFLRQQSRWSRARKRTPLAARPGALAFLVHLANTDIDVRVARLQAADGSVLASALLLLDSASSRQRVLYYATCVVSSIPGVSSGLVLLESIFDWCVACGYDELNLLRGDELYKQQFGARVTWTVYSGEIVWA